MKKYVILIMSILLCLNDKIHSAAAVALDAVALDAEARYAAVEAYNNNPFDLAANSNRQKEMFEDAVVAAVDAYQAVVNNQVLANQLINQLHAAEMQVRNGAQPIFPLLNTRIIQAHLEVLAPQVNLPIYAPNP